MCKGREPGKIYLSRFNDLIIAQPRDHDEDKEYRKEDNVEVVKVEKEGTMTEEKKKEKPEFPLDDYFMAIAVLSGRFSGGSYKVNTISMHDCYASNILLEYIEHPCIPSKYVS